MSLKDTEKFVFGLPSKDDKINGFLAGLLQTISKPVIRFVGSDVINSRTIIANEFLHNPSYSENDVIVWVDCDIVPTVKDVVQLVSLCSEKLPVIGSNVIYNRTNMPNFFLDDFPDNFKVTELMGDYTMANQLARVKYIGFGLVAMHRSVLMKLEEHLLNLGEWSYFGSTSAANFFTRIQKNNYALPETFSFCEKLSQIGIAPHVHLGVRPGHLEQIPVYAKFPSSQTPVKKYADCVLKGIEYQEDDEYSSDPAVHFAMI